MKKRNRILSLLLAGVMALGLTACGASNAGAAADETGSAAVSTESASSDTAASGEKIINVGVTNTIGSLNPLLLNGGEINKYATGLMFLPLMELDADLNFEGMLADSITTEDNKNFIVHIDDAATWSDGTPVTADDVVYTALRLASPVIGNTAMMYYVFEGVGDDGFVEEGAESIDGIQKVDDKTVQFTTKEEMPITTFENSYARYLLTLPKHVIEQYSEEELSTADWFNHPDVVSGPFIVTDFDVDHYISYEANKDYWKGAPKIDKLNIKIVDGSQLYAVQQDIGNIHRDINKLGDEIDTVGALSAAMAGLHPRFQDGNKGELAMAYGGYGGKSALAVGGFYAPNEKVMFSLGLGVSEGGSKMGNFGVNFALDRSRDRKAEARDIVYTRKEVDSSLAAQDEKIKLLLAKLEEQSREIEELKAKVN